MRSVWLIVAAIMAPGVAAAWAALATPTRSEVVFECMTQQQELAPVLRADTCVCLAEIMSSPVSTVRAALTSADNFQKLSAASCRAAAYGALGPDKSSTMRMSPLPTMRH